MKQGARSRVRLCGEGLLRNVTQVTIIAFACSAEIWAPTAHEKERPMKQRPFLPRWHFQEEQGRWVRTGRGRHEPSSGSGILLIEGHSHDRGNSDV